MRFFLFIPSRNRLLLVKNVFLLAFVCLASRLNGYMYSNDTSLNVALFHSDGRQPFTFVPRITLQLLGVNVIPGSVASLIQREWGQSRDLSGVVKFRTYIICLQSKKTDNDQECQ